MCVSREGRARDKGTRVQAPAALRRVPVQCGVQSCVALAGRVGAGKAKGAGVGRKADGSSGPSRPTGPRQGGFDW